ncbi:MAG: nicotinate (nicotinamide) nucleotide adenylyltransferase [Mariprofundaceae bacterium]
MDCSWARRDKKLKKNRIGLFGGSFDPPHLGHETLVRMALDRLKLDEAWVIPVGVPVHRILSGQASAELRMAWVKKIFSDRPNVCVKDWEVSQSEPVAAIRTLKQFRDACPDSVPIWLCGADSFAMMEAWIDYPEHQNVCNVAVFSRAGEPMAEALVGWKLLSLEQWQQNQDIGPGHVIWIDTNLPDISATRLRNMAVQGESLEGLVSSRICKEVESQYKLEAGE